MEVAVRNYKKWSKNDEEDAINVVDLLSTQQGSVNTHEAASAEDVEEGVNTSNTSSEGDSSLKKIWKNFRKLGKRGSKNRNRGSEILDLQAMATKKLNDAHSVLRTQLKELMVCYAFHFYHFTCNHVD